MDELLAQSISVARGMWRHRWPAMLVAWLVAVAGIVVVLAVPDKYEASARIYVDTQSILQPLMAGMTVAPNIDQQVAMLSRTLISRPNVEKLVRMADLDLASNTKVEQEALIEQLMKTLEIRNAGRDNLYTLSFRDSSAERAKRVVQSLTSIFIESSLGKGRKDSDGAKKFIEDQIKAYVLKLEEAESRLKEFRLRNLDMQTNEGGIASMVGDINGLLDRARLELREAEKARDSARSQIEAEKSQASNFTMRSVLQESAMQVATPEVDARLAVQKQSLDGLLQRFTDQHPDVANTRRLIAELEERKQAEVAELRKVSLASPVGAAPAPSLALQELGRMVAASEVQVASLRARVAEYESRARKAREAMKTAPKIEIEFAQLNRDYSVQKKNYESLVARRESASLAGDLEGNSGVVDFRLIDPPRAAPNPVAPNRLLLLPMAIGAALAAGLGLAFVLSQLRAVFFDPHALRSAIGLPILGVVSLVVTDARRAKERRSTGLFALAFGGLMLVFFGASVALTFLANRGG